MCCSHSSYWVCCRFHIMQFAAICSEHSQSVCAAPPQDACHLANMDGERKIDLDIAHLTMHSLLSENERHCSCYASVHTRKVKLSDIVAAHQLISVRQLLHSPNLVLQTGH